MNNQKTGRSRSQFFDCGEISAVDTFVSRGYFLCSRPGNFVPFWIEHDEAFLRSQPDVVACQPEDFKGVVGVKLSYNAETGAGADPEPDTVPFRRNFNGKQHILRRDLIYEKRFGVDGRGGRQAHAYFKVQVRTGAEAGVTAAANHRPHGDVIAGVDEKTVLLKMTVDAGRTVWVLDAHVIAISPVRMWQPSWYPVRRG